MKRGITMLQNKEPDYIIREKELIAQGKSGPDAIEPEIDVFSIYSGTVEILEGKYVQFYSNSRVGKDKRSKLYLGRHMFKIDKSGLKKIIAGLQSLL
jgi:hypothetical protein